MSFILSCEHTIPLNNVCDIFLQLIDTPIKDPATNIRLAWAAATLGTWLLVGLCQCPDDNCSCATQQIKEILHSQGIPGPNILQRTGQEPGPCHSNQAIPNRSHLFCTTHGTPTPPKPHGRKTRHYHCPLHHPRGPNGHG